MGEGNVSIRVGTVGGDKVKAEFVDIGREGQRALTGLTGAGRSSGAALQNVGFQVQDFAVQVASGTSASRALAQQLPQLLSGFGLIGVALGTAVALLAPFAAGLFGGSDAADDFSDSIGRLEKATNALIGAARLAVTPMEQLRAKFGENAEAVNEYYQAQLQLARFDFFAAQAASAENLKASLAEVSSIVQEVQSLEGIAAGDFPGASALVIEQSLGMLQEEFGLTKTEAESLQAALDQLGDARGPQEVFEAAIALQEALAAAEDESGRLPPALQEAYRAVLQLADQALPLLTSGLGEATAEGERFGAIDMSAGIRGAVGETNLLIGRLIAAQQVAANAQAVFDREHKVYGGRGGDPRQFMTPGASAFVPVSLPSGGGGGVSEAQREQNELMREAERLIDRTRTASEKYKIELGELNEMLEKGYIDQETYDRSLADLKDRFGDLDGAARKVKDQFEDFFGSIISGSASAEEALSKLLSSFASDLLSSGLNGLWDSLGLGELFSGLIPSAKGNAFDGGKLLAFANGGVVTGPTLFPMRGATGLMGEAGPEAILPLSRGRDGRLGVRTEGGGGGVNVSVSITVNAQGAVDGVAEQVDARLRAQIPDLVKQTVAGVRDAQKRGRMN